MILEEKKALTPAKINENLVLLILAAVNFTHIMDFVVMAPLGTKLRDVLFISSKQFGFLLSSYTLSAALAGIVGAFFIDKFDRRRALLFLYTGFTLSNLACAISNDYYSFMVARTLAGGFGGVLGSIILSIVGDVVPQERRGRATGIVMAAFSAASVIGIPSGIYLAVTINWHAPFYLLTILSFIVLIGVWFFMPSVTSHLNNPNKKPPLENILNLFKNANVRWSFLFMMLLMMAGLTVVPFLSDYLVRNVGIKMEDLGLVYIFGGLATVVSGPTTGRLADKFGKQKVFVIAAIISIVPIYIMTHLPPSSYLYTLSMSSLFFVFFGARFVPAMSMITSSIDVRQRGSFMSINSSVQQLGSSLAVGIAGVVVTNAADGSLVNFGTCGIVAIIATVACILVSYKVKQVS
ncbi:MAG TPA: MFS transporter [Cytophagaceae bacterium]|jgi:predicted MFS family arabinose efflux permease|nr:MFS transporter [Cytophagaceae bacterium]